DRQKFGSADTAIRAIGTNALPYLVSHLREHDSAIQSKLTHWLSKQHVVKIPFYGENRFYAPSLMALKALGDEAKPFTPELAKLFENTETITGGEHAFIMIGAAGVPALEAACHNTNQLIRIEAALLIAKMKASPNGFPYWGYGCRTCPLNGKPLLFVGWAMTMDDLATANAIIAGLENPDEAVRKANIDLLWIVVKTNV